MKETPIKRVLNNIAGVTRLAFVICNTDGKFMELLSYPEFKANDGVMVSELDREKLHSNVRRYIAGESYDTSFPIRITVPAHAKPITYILSIVAYFNEGKSGRVALSADAQLTASEKETILFMSMITHELRTPLTSILGTLALLENDDGPLNNDQQRLLSIAHRNSERLLLIINDLLDFQSLDAGRMAFHIKPTEFVALARKAVETNIGYADKYGVTFRFAAVKDKIMVNCDPLRTTQIMSNLLSNAAKFSHPGGVVEVTVERKSGFVYFMVQDHGDGIPESFKDKVFDRYAQSEKTVIQSKGGTGLGLYITKMIAEKQGGSVGFASTEGEGSTFYFALPASKG